MDDIVALYDALGVSTLIFYATDENWTERRAYDTIELLQRTAIELDKYGWDLQIPPNHMDIAPIVDWPSPGTSSGSPSQPDCTARGCSVTDRSTSGWRSTRVASARASTFFWSNTGNAAG